MSETDKIRAEAALSSIIDAVPLAVIAVDTEGRVLSWNPAAELIFGWSKAEVLGRSNPIIPPDKQEEFRSILLRIVSGETICGFETKRLRKDGSLIDVSLSTTAVRNESGNIVYIVGILEDISEKKRAAIALAAAEEKFRKVFDSASESIILMTAPVDAAPIIADVNTAALQAHGYSREDLVGKPIDILTAPEEVERSREIARRLSSGQKEAFEISHTDSKGNILTFEAWAQQITLGDKAYFLAVERDISERKAMEKERVKAEEKLRGEKDFTDKLIDSLPGVFYLTDQKGKLLRWNTRGEETTGYSGYELGRMNALDFFREGDKETVLEKITETFTVGSGSIEAPLLTKDGHLIPHLFTGVSLLRDGVPYVIGVGIDVSEIKRAEEAIVRRLEFEKVISAVSSRLLAAHDIGDSINASLADIGSLTGASRAYIFMFNPETRTMDNTHEWCSEGVPPHMENLKDIPFEAFPWLMERISRNEVIHIDDVTKLPDEAKAEKDKFMEEGVKSILALPLHDGVVSGFVGLENIRGKEELHDEDIELLRVISGILVSAFVNRYSDDMLSFAKRDWEDTFNTITDMITIHDEGYNIVRANKAAEKILGLEFSEGKFCKKCFKYYHGTESPPPGCPSCQCLVTGRPETFEIFEPHLNMFIEIRAIPRFDKEGKIVGLIHVVRDITERKKAEEKIFNLNRIYSMLSAINETIVRTKNKKELFDEVCRISVERGLFGAAWVGVVDEDTMMVKAVADFGHDKEFIERMKISIRADVPEGMGPTGIALREGRYFICNDIESADYMDPWKEKALKLGYRSTGAFPIKILGQVKGSLNFCAREANFFTDDEITLLTEVADDVSYAIGFIEEGERREGAERELKNRVEDLEQFYNLSVGRELKMKELKKEIERLNAELSKFKNP